MEELINLHHLDVSGTKIEEMPVQMGRLKSLRQLSAFVVGRSAGSSIGELREFPQLQRLILWNCPTLSSFPKDGLPTTLTTLYIGNCKRLEFLPDEMLAKLTSLESLWIENSCDSLRNFPVSIFPKLKKLDIRGCENLESLSFIEGGVNENLSHLRELFISDCPNLMCFQCQGRWPTPNLNDFTVGKCKNFKSLPEGIHTLTALRLLQVDDLPNLESFAEGGLPPNIRHLCTRSCERLRAPVVKYWGLEGLVSLEYFIIGGSILETLLKEHLLPTALRILVISGCDSILVLPGEGEGLRHLTSLQVLRIDACENLQFLPGEGLQHLTSLQELHITSCHSIQFLPEEGLPLSLSLLSIRNCSTLEKRYQNMTGKDWTKISHIPCIRVNGQVIII
ncbi:PREDICTED: putative disease resistance [Prunus dulcis]|uniref:PREDICTED: putative disease resistance n=1 Tax=Prunus dulcis TaxID=3755 RepID=A0A5E4G8J0_PRUDU|nr:putative disease resistance protein At3g14460 [Prunus dulcis]XP_034203218.1 putative disease resistance protein At3g14460 [Prunus dulcis]VVA36056.1 PREDICTED: putative disease resistance [Prunus dulcis]